MEKVYVFDDDLKSCFTKEFWKIFKSYYVFYLAPPASEVNCFIKLPETSLLALLVHNAHYFNDDPELLHFVRRLNMVVDSNQLDKVPFNYSYIDLGSINPVYQGFFLILKDLEKVKELNKEHISFNDV